MRKIEIGKLYKHFKGHTYIVESIANDSENLDNKLVVYKAVYGDEKTWVRPYDMFNSLVDKSKYPNVKQKYRFEEVKDIDIIVNENMKINGLSKYACSYEKGNRLKKESEDIRPCFYRDIDRIIYSLSYSRYIDKTQVFTHGGNDHISKRMTHVQYVSKIARTIGRALNLNEDLIEAAALGHDLGHTPFGHVGESILNKISLKHNEGYFFHNIESVRLLKDIENHGKGLNISLQVLDAIMCHNGEIAMQEYKPRKKSKNEFLREYNNSYHNKDEVIKMVPMTLEGCVVRISDLIAYLGRDIEDGIRMNLITMDDIPSYIKDTLGSTNREIINTIILDIIKNSINKNYIKLSDDIFKCIFDLKEFNYKNIYLKAYTKEELAKLEEMINTLYEKYLTDLNNHNYNSIIYKNYLNNMVDKYKENTNERIVLDYIAGMTDDYLIKQYESINK